MPDHLHQKAFQHSLQANIIFIVSDGRIIQANRAACKLLGYSKKELLTKYRKDIFTVSDSSYKKMMRQRKAEGSAKADLSMIKKTGKALPCEISSVIFKDNKGILNSILSIVDLRKRLSIQGKIDTESNIREEKNNAWIRSVSKTSYDLIWDWDLVADQLTFGNNFDKIFGYKLPKNKMSFKEWPDFFRPEEKEYSFIRPDGSEGQLISRANSVKDPEGKVIRMIGVIHDRSGLQQLEQTLKQEIRIRERQIIEAIVEAKEMERSDLGKELHDNINQLLGASMLYLDMARKDVTNGEIYLIHSYEYTLTAIEEIRKLTKGLTTDALNDFGLCMAIENTCRDTMETYPVKIYCTLDPSMEETMSVKFKLNTFRILQEQLNNILRHAKATHINITISHPDAGLMLSIEDDGVGFDTTQKSKGIGLTNIISRAELYKGNARFISSAGKGCLLSVTFPEINPN